MLLRKIQAVYSIKGERRGRLQKEREREREVSQIENWRAVSFGESDNRK